MTAPLIRALAAREADEAVEWAAREGWNPGRADAAAFLAQDPGAFRGLFVDGALAVTLSATAYDGGFTFIGFYICRPDLRGRGLGYALWQDTLGRIGGTLGLDGVLAQEKNYARSGFVLAHRNIRYGGKAPAGMPDPRVVAIAPAQRGGVAHAPAHLNAVAQLDRTCFGFARPAFLGAWLAPPFGHAMAFVADGAVKGFGVIRACREGHKIGPLFADDPAVADALFRTLAATVPGAPVFLDVPEPNAAARTLAGAAGLSPVFETARMYRGAAPDLPLGRIFGITTFELG